MLKCAGTRRWNSFDLNLNTSLKQSWSLGMGVTCCDFYDGSAVQASALEYAPGSEFFAALGERADQGAPARPALRLGNEPGGGADRAHV